MNQISEAPTQLFRGELSLTSQNFQAVREDFAQVCDEKVNMLL